jgi:protein subunit release factor B
MQKEKGKGKELLFSITKKSFVIEYYNPGKNGGQNANKVATACRIHHPESGAIGDCHEERTQKPNRERAFKRLVASPKFKKWLRLETAKRLGQLDDIEKKVDKAMAEAVVEVRENDKWVKAPARYFNNIHED